MSFYCRKICIVPSREVISWEWVEIMATNTYKQDHEHTIHQIHKDHTRRKVTFGEILCTSLNGKVWWRITKGSSCSTNRMMDNTNVLKRLACFQHTSSMHVLSNKPIANPLKLTLVKVLLTK